MAKMYTLDEKLLVGVPEIRIGEKIYKVDDREKTAIRRTLKRLTRCSSWRSSLPPLRR